MTWLHMYSAAPNVIAVGYLCPFLALSSESCSSSLWVMLRRWCIICIESNLLYSILNAVHAWRWLVWLLMQRNTPKPKFLFRKWLRSIRSVWRNCWVIWDERFIFRCNSQEIISVFTWWGVLFLGFHIIFGMAYLLLSFLRLAGLCWLLLCCRLQGIACSNFSCGGM